MYRFIRKIFTHNMCENLPILFHTLGEINTGNARFHAQFQVNLHSFDQNILSFKNSLNSKPYKKKRLIWSWIFRYFSFTFYIQFILFAGKEALEVKRTFDHYLTLTHASLILNFIAEGHLWARAGNKSAQNLIVAEFLQLSIILLVRS